MAFGRKLLVEGNNIGGHQYFYDFQWKTVIFARKMLKRQNRVRSKKSIPYAVFKTVVRSCYLRYIPPAAGCRHNIMISVILLLT